LTALTLANHRLYIAGGFQQDRYHPWLVTVVDVSNPAAPVGLGRYLMPGSMEGHGALEASGDYIYSAHEGLYVLHYTGGTLPVYTSYLPLASRNR
jgi:hypothetical protein